MAYDVDMADRLRKILASEPGVVEKPMFGGLAFMVAGHMAVSARHQGGLLLHVNPVQTDREGSATSSSLRRTSSGSASSFVHTRSTSPGMNIRSVSLCVSIQKVVDAVGELVVTAPMPSMPLYFWADPGGERYRQSYFETFPGVWRHGDFVTITSRGTAVIHGRSDSTINRQGVRMGSADFYAAVEQLPEVTESLVIGAEMPDGGCYLPLFVVLASGVVLVEGLRQRINDTIRAEVSPRHVPDEIIAVPGVPHTLTGKRVEVPIKRLLQGVPVEAAVNLGALVT